MMMMMRIIRMIIIIIKPTIIVNISIFLGNLPGWPHSSSKPTIITNPEFETPKFLPIPLTKSQSI